MPALNTFELSKRPAGPPASWLAAYPEASFEGIDRDNYLGSIGGSDKAG